LISKVNLALQQTAAVDVAGLKIKLLTRAGSHFWENTVSLISKVNFWQGFVFSGIVKQNNLQKLLL
jgi:hypothetical protein